MAAQTQIDLVPTDLHSCVCMDNKAPCDLCCGKLCFLDQGIRVKHTTKKGEEAIGLVLDDCVFTDNQKNVTGCLF